MTPPFSASEPKIYRCGSLTYTKRHLAVLFAWLLWGDICYILMEAVVPTLMPLKFKALEASNTVISVIMTTIPMLMNTVLNPIISFRSDRYRSRWGRRIPFILFTAPFIVLCLAGLAYGDVLGHRLQEAAGPLLADLGPNTVAIGVIGVMMVLFSFFNTFVNAVFWYLFNDVVPEALLARFMSWFRLVSLAATSLYSLFVFPLAADHSREILIGAGLLYLVGFGLMCLNVKEGAYPPPPENIDGKAGVLSSIKTFGRECHSHWHYWYVFLGAASFACVGTMGSFMVLFYMGTGLDLAHIGKLSSTLSISTALLVLVSGWLADRYHPIRVVLGGQLMQILIVFPVTTLWLFWQPDAHTAFWVWIGITVLLTAPARALVEVSDPPMLMRIFPRERYGQFCSANSMWRSLGAIVGSVLAGVYLDVLKARTPVANVYAFIPVWQWFFTIPWCLCTWKLYRSWKAYGGDAGYRPPVVEATVPASVDVVAETR